MEIKPIACHMCSMFVRVRVRVCSCVRMKATACVALVDVTHALHRTRFRSLLNAFTHFTSLLAVRSVSNIRQRCCRRSRSGKVCVEETRGL